MSRLEHNIENDMEIFDFTKVKFNVIYFFKELVFHTYCFKTEELNNKIIDL